MLRGFHSPAVCRPQGFVTLSATYSFRARAGLFSCRRRSWALPFEAFPSRKGVFGVPAATDPPAVSLADTADACTPTRLVEPRLPGVHPIESP